MKDEFMPPVSFELILRHKEKKALQKVVKWLLTGYAGSPFQWEVLADSTTEWRLSIQSSWASNLLQIAKILRHYHVKEPKIIKRKK